MLIFQMWMFWSLTIFVYFLDFLVRAILHILFAFYKVNDILIVYAAISFVNLIMGNSQSSPKIGEEVKVEIAPTKLEETKSNTEQRVNPTEKKQNRTEGKQQTILQHINSQLLTPLIPIVQVMYGWPSIVMSIPLVISYAYLKRFRSLRYLIDKKQYPTPFWKLTTYTNNLYGGMGLSEYMVLSHGEPGIGKTKSILNFITQTSHEYPIIYIPLKTTLGRQSVDQQIKAHIKLEPFFSKNSIGRRMEWCDHTAFHMLKSQLNNMTFMRQNENLCLSALLSPLALLGTLMGIATLSDLPTMALIAVCGSGMLLGKSYFWLVKPFLKYCVNKTIPMVVFDDINIMALHEDIEQVHKCSELYRMMVNRQANVFLLASDPRTYFVLKDMPGNRDTIRHLQLKFDPKYTYELILKDKETDFQNFKQSFMSYVWQIEGNQKIFSNQVMEYFIEEIIQRELTLRKMQNIFADGKQNPSSFMKDFIKKFNDEFQKGLTCSSQNDNKLKQIVKEIFEMYDEQEKQKIDYLIQNLRSFNWLKDKKPEDVQTLEKMILDLGEKTGSAENEPFKRKTNNKLVPFYNEFINVNLLKQDGHLLKFKSKMTKIAFKAWFEQVRNCEEHETEEQLPKKGSQDKKKN